MADELITRSTWLERHPLRISVATFERHLARGLIPAPDVVFNGRRFWRTSSFQHWLQQFGGAAV